MSALVAALAACSDSGTKALLSAGTNPPDQLPPTASAQDHEAVDAFGVPLPIELKLVRRTMDVVVVQGAISTAEVLGYLRDHVTFGIDERPDATVLEYVSVPTKPAPPMRIELVSVSKGVTRVTVFRAP